MEAAEDFNGFVEAHLSGKIDKRKKADFAKILETSAHLLESEIIAGKTKLLESLFKAETWDALHSSIESFDLNTNEEIKNNSLKILQLITLIIPKRGRKQHK